MAKKIDLRTYLALEKAFVRRLQRSWRQQSAPLYQQITQHCINHQWDKARQLVPLLDMAEVGTENREWITYMLLSFAVFGAGTVAKKKPSFVGVGSFDTFLKQVTNNILMYLEYSGTAQVQREALQSIAEDEAKTKALKREYVRDEKGQFAETVGKALIKAGRVTTDPNNTFFLLPNGTRVTAAGYNSHAKLAAAAGYNDLNKVIESGVVRYIPGVGIEANHLTETQAKIVVEDWEAYFAGPKGWNAIQVDLIGREDRLVLGASSLSHRFDRLSVDALLNFVNRTTKWDESKHPRDKEGQFASSAGFTAEERARLANPPPIEGGYGPARAEWEKRNKASMEAFEVFMDAKAAHRVHVNKASLRMEQLAEEHPDETVEALEARVYSDPEYVASRAALRAADRAMKAADDARARQEPVMRKEVVTNLAHDVAEKMGINPRVIHVVDKPPSEFKVGDKDFTEAGHYSPGSRTIELNAQNIGYAHAPSVKGVTAHEISHLIYHTLKQEAELEFQDYLSEAVTPDGKEHTSWYHERFEMRDGTRRLKPEYREEFAKAYPAAMVLATMAEGEPFTGIAQSMVEENGHSEYAKSYWTPEAIATRGHSYESAINETIAEVTRYITNPTSWGEKGTPDNLLGTPSVDSPWMKLTVAMHEWYRERQDKIDAERQAAVYAGQFR